jgi:RNA polymerase sigma-70 factor (ECF subfamily)
MRDSDAELAAAYRSGIASALEALYWRHAERVWRYARYFSGSEELAADIVQETFVRVAQHLGSFEGRAQFSTWLFSIVRSVAIDQCVRQRKQTAVPIDNVEERVAAVTPGPAEELADSETRAAVRAAIAKLPENEREAVLLCEIGDLPILTACEILGWGESRVKITLFRARRHLKVLLASQVSA